MFFYVSHRVAFRPFSRFNKKMLFNPQIESNYHEPVGQYLVVYFCNEQRSVKMASAIDRVEHRVCQARFDLYYSTIYICTYLVGF